MKRNFRISDHLSFLHLYYFSMSDVSSSEGASSTKVVSLKIEGSFKELLKEDLISDESFIPKVSFSGKKVPMHK